VLDIRTMKNVSEYNRQFNEGLNLFVKGKFRTCLFASGCPEPVIQAHSVSRAVLKELESDGHVIAPWTRNRRDDEGRSYANLEFQLQGINLASTGTFVCRTHDAEFAAIDKVPIDFNNPEVCDLLFYRAILKDAWQLLRTQFATMWLERDKPLPMPKPIHPYSRLRALLEAAERIRPWLDPTRERLGTRPVVHLVRRMKTECSVVAASCAGGGSDLAFSRRSGRELSPGKVREITGAEPNTCWSFTVVPQPEEHVMVASWLATSAAETYFKHFKEVQGEELQAAVSAELIIFCENWYLNPRVWESFSQTRKSAIAAAYDNMTDLWSGEYVWRDRPNGMPWFEYLNLRNRQQLNLFRHKKTALVG